jgi:hypothetical protein
MERETPTSTTPETPAPAQPSVRPGESGGFEPPRPGSPPGPAGPQVIDRSGQRGGVLAILLWIVGIIFIIGLLVVIGTGKLLF